MLNPFEGRVLGTLQLGTGTVRRPIERVEPGADGGSVMVFAVCGHRQQSNRSPEMLVKLLKHEVCVACSRPRWDREDELRSREPGP